MSLDDEASERGPSPEARLAVLGLTLPKVSPPLAAYVPAPGRPALSPGPAR